MKMKNGEKRKNDLKLSELLENVPSKIYLNDVVGKEKLDERISGVDSLFINIIGVNATNIDFLPNDNPPKLNEVLAWIWVFRPDLMEEILKYNINPEFLKLLVSYKSGDMEQYWKSLME